MDEYQYELRVPKDRIAVLIGKKGEIKNEIEEETKTKIDIDSKEGDVFVTGQDALGIYTAREVIQAVSRGFNPEIALLLLKPDYVLEFLDIKDFAGKSKEHQMRLKGRVIGREGKSRKIIEELTESHVCVYGKTICIIGPAESASMAKRAIESLLKGSTHANVYKWLEKRRADMKMKNLLGKDIN